MEGYPLIGMPPAEGVFWSLCADAKPRGLWLCDDLAAPWAEALASRGSPGEDPYSLFCKAEHLLSGKVEDDEAALTAATKAEGIFRSRQDTQGLAFASRLVMHCHRAKARRLGIPDGKFDPGTTLSELVSKSISSISEEKDKLRSGCVCLSASEMALEAYGQKSEAVEWATKARQCFQKVQDLNMEARAILTLGIVHLAHMDGKSARDFFTLALGHFRAAGDRYGQGKCLHGIALVEETSGDLEAALASESEALTAFKQLGHVKLVAFAHHNIARWHLVGECPRQAVAAAKDAFVIFGDLQYGYDWAGGSLRTVVEAYIARCDFGTAVRVATRALKKFQDARDKRAITLALDALANAHIASGNSSAALSVVDEAMESCLKCPSNRRQLELEAVVSHTKSRVLFAAHYEQEAASEGFLRAAEIYRELKDSRQEQLAYWSMWDAACNRLDGEVAMDAAAKALDAATRAGDKFGQGCSRICMAKALALSGQGEQGIQEALRARGLIEDSGGSLVALAALWGAMASCKEAADIKGAITDTKRACELLKEAGRMKSLATLLVLQSQLHSSDQSSLEAFRIALHARSACREAMGKAEELTLLLMAMQAACSVLSEESSSVQSPSCQRLLSDGLAAAREAEALAQSLGDGHRHACVCFWQSNLCVLSGNREREGVQYAHDALEGFQRAEDWRAVGQTKLLMGQLYANMPGMEKAAIASATEAMETAIDCHDTGGEESARKLLESLGVEPQARVEYLALPGFAGVGDDSQLVPSSDKVQKEVETTIVAAKAKHSIGDIKSYVKEVCLEAVAHDDDLMDDSPLMELGLDSLGAVQVRNDIAKKFDISLPPSLVFDCPNIASLSELVLQLTEEAES